MSDTLIRAFPTDPNGIAAADEWIEEVGIDLGIAGPSVFKARLCVAELGANLLEHGGATSADDFTVALSRDQDQLEVEFADRGRPFDPTGAEEIRAPETVEEASVGGLGLHLLQTMASRVVYWRDGSWNRLRLLFPAAA